jgi:hypothetical protein
MAWSYRFFWSCEGDLGSSECLGGLPAGRNSALRLPSTFCVSDSMMGSERVTLTRRSSLPPALCLLRRHFVRIPEFSFLPQSQRDR